MKVREPVERPLDVVAIELLLSASQAYAVGVLMYLAIGLWADRGVGLASVAVILALLSLAVGGGWLYWLLGGSGWPLAAACVPVAMYAGFTLVLGSQGGGFSSLEPWPLLLLLAASSYGIVGGVFLDSPRRWRWDQRRALRPGTKVPRVSPTTKALVARMPRSLPTRSTATEPGWPTPAASTPPRSSEASAAPGGPPSTDGVGDPPSPSAVDAGQSAPSAGSASARDAGDLAHRANTPADAGQAPGAPSSEVVKASGAGDPPSLETPTPVPPRRDPRDVVDRAPDGSIELPTSVEPRPQRSPWAWASPPEWNRGDEDDRDEPKERDR